ncbi:fructokinase-like 1, chloroplastic [Nymphaea colorata]|nr:fructokinase-like 1, chloroplastic [Nymphaea colorata]
MASAVPVPSFSQVPLPFSCSSLQSPSAGPLNALPASSRLPLRKVPAPRPRHALDYSIRVVSLVPTSGKLKKMASHGLLQSGGSEKVFAHYGRLEENTVVFRSRISGEFGTLSVSLQRGGAKKIGASKTTSSSEESPEAMAGDSKETAKSKRRASKKSRGEELVGSSGDAGNTNTNLAKPASRGRKKSSTRKTKSGKKVEEVDLAEKEKVGSKEEEEDEGGEDYDDMMDFPYESPGLICCFGAAQREFVPSVRVSDRQMHPDIYSTWKGLQWSPPEFSRAPGGPPSNVAIAHVRLGGRAAFMGKVGNDEFGNDLVYKMNTEKVQTRAVKIDPSSKTAMSYMKIVCKGGKLSMKTVKECAEDSLKSSELNLAVLKEAKIFHFNSEVLTSPSMHAALFKAIRLSKKFGGYIFFDPNMPLPLWKSREEAWDVIKEAWNQANIIELTKQELEFLLDEQYYEKKREYRPQYYAESYDQTKKRRDYYHYTREEISPLWHDNIKILFITDGLFRIHYYTPQFEGTVIGTEDVLITPFTCDRTGSGDALVAGIMRKLVEHPEVYEDQDKLERDLRFAISAGIISQWTIGAVRGFPTESATQNLKEQVYIPSMW